MLSTVVAAIYITQFVNEQHLQGQRHEVLNEISLLRARLEGNINANLLSAYGLTSVINAQPNLDQKTFELHAQKLLNEHAQLRNIGAAPNLILKLMFPLENNSGALGLNYRENTAQWPAVKKSIETKKMVVAGPVNLVQGGSGLIGRIPVYVNSGSQNEQFWGIVSAVIDFEAFLQASGFNELEHLQLAMKGKDAKGEKGEVFLGNDALFDNDPLTVTIELPYGSWVLAATPANGWAHQSPKAVAAISVILAIGLALLSFIFIAYRNAQISRDTNLKLQALFDLSPFGIALTDVKSGNFVQVNSAFTQCTHYTIEHLKHFLPQSIYLKPESYEVSAVFDPANPKHSIGPIEAQLACKSGSNLPINFSAVTFSDTSENHYAWCIFEDITEKRNAKIRLEETVRDLELIISSTGVGLWDWEIPTGKTVFNERWAEMIGYSLQELEPVSINTWMDFAHPDDLKESEARLKAHWDGKSERYIFESRMRHKAGNWIWVLDTGKVIEWDEDGKPLRMVGTHLDITAHKLALLQLEQSQSELDQFFNLSINFMCIANLNGYFERVNRSFTEKLGYSDEELLQNPFIDFIHPEDAEKTLDEVAKLSRGEQTIEFTNRFRKANGDYLILSWNTSPDINKNLLYACAIDETEKKRAEEKVHHQQLMLESMSQQARVGAWEYNSESGELIWSRMTKLIHEVPEDYQPCLNTALDFCKEEEDREHVQLCMDEAKTNGTPWLKELRILTAKGRELWVEARCECFLENGKVTRLYGSVKDIDELKRNEERITKINEALEKQMKLMEFVTKTQSSFITQTNINESFDTMLSGVLQLTQSEFGFMGEVLQQADGTPYLKTLAISNITWNEETSALYEQNKEKGMEFFNLKTLFGEAIVTKEPVIANTPSNDNRSSGLPQGHPALDSFLGLPLLRNGEIVALIGVANRPGGYDEELVQWLSPLSYTVSQIIEGIRAIRVGNEAKAALIKAKDEAEQATRAKSEFLAIMSHEIRTPLNGIMGMLNLLQKSQLDEEQQRKAKIAQTSASTLLTLINDILDFSKVDAGKLDLEVVDFNLRSMLDEFCESMAFKSEEKGLELIIDQRLVKRDRVKGDPGRIRQILTNLVGNAIKFTHQGEIIVRAELVDNVPDRKEGLELRVEVIDTGIGISKDKLGDLFNPFTQVDASTTRQYGGTGLGLAICKKLCELMHGGIQAESEYGAGSTFSFHVTLQPSTSFEEIKPRFDIKKLSIIVVDDNTQTRDCIAGQLQLWGAQVTTAANAKSFFEVCEKVRNNPDKPFDLALIDWNMPGLNGTDIAKRIRSENRFKNMPLVIMGASNHRKEIDYFSKIGFSGYFPKPITTSDLFFALSHVKNNKSLPQSPSSKPQDGYDPMEPIPTWPKKTRLLLVEDNSVNQDVAKLMLNDIHLDAAVAGNGVEALKELCSTSPKDRYTVILMDCQMPELDGYETTRKIRQGEAGEHHRNIPIIALTANAMKGDKQKCLDAGMNDYLSKPIDDLELLKKLRLWLCQSIDELETSVGEEPALAPPTKENTVWDEEAAIASLKGRKDRLKILLRSFLSRLPETADNIRTASSNNNYDEIAFLAHSLKGSSAQLSAHKLNTIAGTLEQQARDRDEQTNATADNLLLACKELEVRFRSFTQKP